MSKLADFSSSGEINLNERSGDLFIRAIEELGDVFTEIDIKAFEMMQDIYEDSYNTYNAWISLFNKKNLRTSDQIKETFKELMIEDLNVQVAIRSLNRGFISCLMDYVYLVYGVRIVDFKQQLQMLLYNMEDNHLNYVDIMKVFIATLDEYALNTENVLNTQAIIDIKNDLGTLIGRDAYGKLNVIQKDKQIVFNFRVIGTKQKELVLKLDKVYPVLRALLCFNTTTPVLKGDVISEYGDVLGDKIGLEIPLNPAYTIMWFKINKSGSIVANFYTKSYAEQFFNLWCGKTARDVDAILACKSRDIKIKQHTAFTPRKDIKVYDIADNQDGERNIIEMPYWEYYFSPERYIPVESEILKQNIVELPIRKEVNQDDEEDEEIDYSDQFDYDDYEDEEYEE